MRTFVSPAKPCRQSEPLARDLIMVQMSASLASKGLVLHPKRSGYQMDFDHRSLPGGPQSRVPARSGFLMYLWTPCLTSACFVCLAYMLCSFCPVVAPVLAQQKEATNGNHAARQTAETVLSPSAAAVTAKERLGEKWTDEQRVDNCKVPLEKRGSKLRPDTCSSLSSK